MIQLVPHGEFSIKNLKSCNGRDGIAWSCTLYRGRRKIGYVRNSGCGGDTMIDWEGGGVTFDANTEDAQALRDHVATLLPRHIAELNRDLPWDSDLFIGVLADDFESTRKLKRHCKNKTLFRIDGDEEGMWRTLSVPFSDMVKRDLERHYPDVEILNETINQ